MISPIFSSFFDVIINVYRLNSEKLFFVVDIFRGSNRLFDSVRDAESHDVQILTGFPENLILEILKKIVMA